MAGGLLISLYIYDEMNFDTMFKDADRIHRINTDVKIRGYGEQIRTSFSTYGLPP